MYFEGPSTIRVIFQGFVFAAFSGLWGAAAYYGLRKALADKKENFFTDFARRFVSEHEGAARALTFVLPVVWLFGIVKDTSNIANFVSPLGFWWQIAALSSIIFGLILAARRHSE